MTAYSKAALAILREPSTTFVWYIIPLFLVVLYAYGKEIQKRDWNVFFAGIALWGMDLFNEIWNSIVFHATNYAPVWGAPGRTALLLLIGYNIEISMMFALMGLFAASILPKEKKAKVLGINNRVLAVAFSTLAAVVIECVLNKWGVLTWEYSWWSIRAPWLIYLVGYLPFFAICVWVHDMEKVKSKIIAVSVILGIDIFLLTIFGAIGWM